MTTAQRLIKYAAIALAALLIVTMICGIVMAVNGILTLFGGREDLAGEMKCHSVSGNPENLQLEIGAAALKIQQGDSFRVESNHKFLQVTTKGNTLTIKESKGFHLNINANGVVVTLTIPKDFSFVKADITTGAGKVEISDLSCNFLSLELGAGDAAVRNLYVHKEAEIDGGAGKLTISDCFVRNLELNMGIGQANLSGQLEGKCELSMGVGEVDVNLSGSLEDYAISYSSGIGSGTLNGESMKNGKTYGTGSHSIEIDGGIGSIHIVCA